MKDKEFIKIVESGDFSQGGQLVIRPIATSQDLFSVYRLTNDFYKSKGVMNLHPDGIWAQHPEFDHYVGTTVLVAFLKEAMVGSISMTRDGLKGLLVDRQFGRTCALIRSSGRTLGEVWRLVVRGADAERRHIAEQLVIAAIERFQATGVETALLTLHPEFVDMSQRQLNGVALLGGQMSPGAGIFSLPSVLMRCDIEKFPLQTTAAPATLPRP